MPATIENGVNALHVAQQAVHDAEQVLEDAKKALRQAKATLAATEFDVVLLELRSASCGMFPDYDSIEYVTNIGALGKVVVHRLVDGQQISTGRDARLTVESRTVVYEWFEDGLGGGDWCKRPLIPGGLNNSFAGSDVIWVYFQNPNAETVAADWLRERYQLELPAA